VLPLRPLQAAEEKELAAHGTGAALSSRC